MATESDEYSTDAFDNQIVRMKHLRPLTRELRSLAIVENALKATKTGTMVSVDDAYAGHLLGLTVYCNSVQDGTPTPESPVPIKSVGHAIVNTNNNVNLCGGSAIASQFVSSSSFGEDEYGRYVANIASYANKKIFIQGGFKPNTAYTLILKYRSAVSSGTTNTTIYYTDGTKETYSNGSPTEGAITLVVTTDPAKTVDRFCGSNSSGTAYLYYDECGLFEGVLTADDFVPYAGSSTVLNLIDDQGVAHELRSLPDGTRDELILNADGSGTLVEKCRFAHLSSLSAVSQTDGQYYAYVNLPLGKAGVVVNPEVHLGYCDKLVMHQVAATNFVQHTNAFKLARTSADNPLMKIYVRFDGTQTTLEEFNQKMSEIGGIDFMYPYETPVTYHIPAINMPSLPALTSNVWVAARDKPTSFTKVLSNNELAIEYRRDINKVIGDIEEAIADIVSQ